MSLLTNPWFSAGMGLLASSGPSLAPVNPWAGIGQGLMNAQNAQAQEQESAYQQWRVKQAQEEAARQEQQRQRVQEMAANAPPEMRALAEAYPDVYAKGRAEQAFAGPGESVQLKTAGELGLQDFPPNTPVQVKMKGNSVVDYAPINPPSQTDGIKLEKNGHVYTAKSVDEANEMARQGWSYYKPPPNIAITEGDKPVSVADAANLRYPDGSRVIPGTPMSTIYARGAVSVTQADNTEAVTDANIKGYNESLKAAGAALRDANKAYKENPTATNYQMLKAARSSAATALAQRRNTKGEPSGEIVQAAEADFPLPFSMGGAMGAATGSDPIDASLRQVDELYGLGLYAPKESKDKPKGVKGDVFDKYGLKRPGQ